MTTWVCIEAPRLPVDDALRVCFEEAFAAVGGRVRCPDAASFLDLHGHRRVMEWSEIFARGLAGQLIHIDVDLTFEVEHSYGLMLEWWMDGPRSIRELGLVAPVDAFARSFSEEDRDRSLRLQHCAERLHSRLGATVTEAFAKHDEARRPWFRFSGALRTPIAMLRLETCEASRILDGTSHLGRWMDRAARWIACDAGAREGLFLCKGASRARLLNCPVCGARLAHGLRSSRDGSPLEPWQLEMLHRLWRLRDLGSIEREFGQADFRLPGLELDSMDRSDGLHDVVEQLVYWDLRPGHPTIFRQYSNGRIAVDHAIVE